MSEVKKIATRESYGNALVELGKENENVVVLDADLSTATKTNLFAKQYPTRFFDMGIAEANMIGTAAGLATCGKIAYASTFAAFAAGRAYDQIRCSVAYPKLNVKICATHSGVTVGEDGATHQMIEDLAMMRTMPNMTVISTSDDTETKWAVKEISKYNENKLSEYRAENIGFIFQFYNILPTLTVLENVELIKDVVRNGNDSIEAIKAVGLEKHINKFPNQLSGGEQQRVALARALVNNPSMIIADEPTGNLDPDTAWDIMTLLNDINLRGTTVVVATHAKDIVDQMNKRVIHIRKGSIVKDDEKGGYEL